MAQRGFSRSDRKRLAPSPAETVDHGKWQYVREDRLVPPINSFLRLADPQSQNQREEAQGVLAQPEDSRRDSIAIDPADTLAGPRQMRLKALVSSAFGEATNLRDLGEAGDPTLSDKAIPLRGFEPRFLA